MIIATDIELRAGARLLVEGASFQVSAGDRIGLVGRNGAGKTTLAKVLAGEAQPAAGSVRRSGTVGYLPQDPRTGNPDMLAIDRVLSARGLDQLRAELRAAEAEMAAPDSAAAADAIRRYGRLEDRLSVLGGYAAESQAASITASLGLPDRRTEPAAGWASPASTLASVVLPAPFRPTRPIRSPADTWNDALSSSRRAPARSSISLATIMI